MHKKIALVLFLLAILIVTLKVNFLEEEFSAERQAWDVLIHVQFDALTDTSRLTLQTPYETEFIKEVRQTIEPGRLHLSRLHEKNQRLISASVATNGTYALNYQTTILQSEVPGFLKKPVLPPSARSLEGYLSNEHLSDVMMQLIKALSRYLQLEALDKDEIYEKTFYYLSNMSVAHL